ncbi:hypothetical protein ANN_09890 [Periplaneta americana]|uniref:Reverse transcriptase domain-containing protein n=1 Tax=Periplaneta americana TaxID=6978 RepID=A0ABQ8TMJ7_PERAM|nr:hypothetical protein ANN_09890 [Periplaneta americana]
MADGRKMLQGVFRAVIYKRLFCINIAHLIGKSLGNQVAEREVRQGDNTILCHLARAIDTSCNTLVSHTMDSSQNTTVVTDLYFLMGSAVWLQEGKGTRDAIGLLRTIGERYLEKNKEVYIVFVDLEKAFDRVDCNKLMRILKKIGVGWKERRLFSNLYMKQVKVRIGEDMSEESEIEELQQSRPLPDTNQILEKSTEFNLTLYIAFVDYNKAFESVDHNSVEQALNKQGVNSKYIRN